MFLLNADAASFLSRIVFVQAKLKDVNNINWCKFIADFLHDAFSNKMYEKGCRLHLMVFPHTLMQMLLPRFILS